MNCVKKQVFCIIVTMCCCTILIGDSTLRRSAVPTPEKLQEMLTLYRDRFQRYLDRSGLTVKERKQLTEFKNFLDTSIMEASVNFEIAEAKLADFRKTIDIGTGGLIDQGDPRYVRLRDARQRWKDKFDNLMAGEEKLVRGEADPRLVSLELQALMEKAAQTTGGVRGTLGSTGLAEKQLKGELVPTIVKKIEAISPRTATPDEQEAEWADLGIYGNVERRVKYIQGLANELMEIQQNKAKRINDEMRVQAVEADLVFLLTYYQDFNMSPFIKRAITTTITQLMSEGEEKKPTYEVASAPVTVASRPFGASEGRQERPEFATIQLKKSGERAPREPITTVRPIETSRMQVQRSAIQEMPAARPTAAPQNTAIPPIVQKVLMISPTQKTVDEQNAEWNRLKIRFAIKDRARYAKDLANELIRGQKNAQTRIDDRDLYNAVAHDLVILLDQYLNDRSVMNDASLSRLVRQALDQLRP